MSIITPTWQRHDLLMETIQHVRQQTYPNIEHVIVSDGPDPELARVLHDTHGVGSFHDYDSDIPISFADLGRNWSTFLPRSFGVAPLTAGALMARGEYQMWLCDDERMQQDHVEHLVELIERTGADFVYPQVLMWKPSHPGVAWTIGADPPKHGQITNFLYRASALRKAMYRFDIPVEGDWDLVSRWMEAGASWAMSDRCTISHRADH